MLTFNLPGTPVAFAPDAHDILGVWTPAEGNGPPAPWGGPSQQLDEPVPCPPTNRALTDCFTVELWLQAARPSSGRDCTLAVCTGSDGEKVWSLGITRHLMPRISWRDRSGASRAMLGDSLADLFDPPRWLHIAVVHHGAGRDPAQAASEYARWALYVTPAGEAWPRLMLQEQGDATVMPPTGGRVTLLPAPFAVAGTAISSHAKLPNEFPTLGQLPPPEIRLNGDFPGGSCRSPVHIGPRQVVVACEPDSTDANYWFFARVELGDPADQTPVDLTVLATPKGQAMLNCLFYSTDGARWQRLTGAWFASDRRHAAQGFLRVAVPTDVPEFWLAASPPYRNEDVDELIADVESDPRVEVLSLGSSASNRPIRGVRITDPEKDAAAKDFIFLQAGQHSPMEQATGLVLDRLVRGLLADRSFAELLATHEVYVVPLVNVDAAARGGAGATEQGLNSNRYWLGEPIPETAGIRDLLGRLAQRDGRMRLALDLHAVGVWANHVTLFLSPQRARALCPQGWSEEMERWLSLLEKHTGIARQDALETGEGLVHFATAMATTRGWPAATLELSFFTWQDTDGSIKPVTQESLEQCGVRLAQALTEFVSTPSRIGTQGS